MKRYGVRLSDRLSAACLLLWARRTEDIDRSLQQRRANAGSATSAYVGRFYGTVRCPSVCPTGCLSVPAWAHSSKLAAACLLLWSGGQEISIDCCSSEGQMQTVPRCQRQNLRRIIYYYY